MSFVRLGRYALFEAIASGGMASVHLGRLQGAVGFARTVAIKRLHPQLAADPEFVAMFLDEARLAARIQHTNVVATLDVVATDGEIFLVMDYIQGESLSQLRRASNGSPVPVSVATSVMIGAANGLHAAHEAQSERGEPLHIVHRDVSPQNILVGVDGIARVVDFGVAKAASRLQSTRDGQVKGKLAYMSPEQIRRQTVDRRADIYAAGVVLWELLAGRKLFVADDAAAIAIAVLEGAIPKLSEKHAVVPKAIDDVIARATAPSPDDRFPTAAAFAEALALAAHAASQNEVAHWVKSISPARLEERQKLVSAIEQTPSSDDSADVLAAVASQKKRIVESPTAKLDDPAKPDEESPSRLTALSSPSVPSSPPPRRRSWLVFAVPAALVTAAIAFVGIQRARVPATATATTTTAAAPLPTSAPTAPVSTANAPSASPSIAPSAPTAHATTRLHPHATSTSTSTKSDCNPPYVVDSTGIKRYKPECL